MRTAVDLPAPFGPSSPNTIPGWTVKLSEVRACTVLPYVLPNSTASMAASGGGIMRSLAGRRELPCSLRARTVGSTASVDNSGVSSVAAVLAHRGHGSYLRY